MFSVYLWNAWDLREQPFVGYLLRAERLMNNVMYIVTRRVSRIFVGISMKILESETVGRSRETWDYKEIFECTYKLYVVTIW